MRAADRPGTTWAPSTWGPGVPLVAAVLLAVSGCSAGSDDDAAPAAEAAPQEGTEQSAPGTAEDDASSDDAAEGSGAEGSGAEGSGAGVRTVDPADVVVEQEVAVPTAPDDLVTWGVQSLTVEGDVMVLRMVLTPDFASEPPTGSVSLYDVMDSSPWQPTLVDRENLTEYSLIAESGRSWASDTVSTQTQNGEPIAVWGVFAAPQEDVDVLDLRLDDAWPEFTDVPVTR